MTAEELMARACKNKQDELEAQEQKIKSFICGMVKDTIEDRFSDSVIEQQALTIGEHVADTFLDNLYYYADWKEYVAYGFGGELKAYFTKRDAELADFAY